MRLKHACTIVFALAMPALLMPAASAQDVGDRIKRELRDLLDGPDKRDKGAQRDRDRRDGRDDWVELGCKRVGFLVDRDVIRVGRREGRFKAIRVAVSDNRVHMYNLRVVYTNGAPDDIEVRSEIRPGSRTRALDLRGRERSIDRIELVYRSEPSLRGQANVCVEGLT
jgi:hypothetical protein